MTEKRMLRYNFTPEEHLANCDEMARLFGEQGELEATQKSIKSQLKEDEETLNAKLGRHVRFVRDKYDHRPIDCKWLIDNPKPGQKSLVRLDTYDTVEIRAMDEWEKQQSLNLQPAPETAEASPVPASGAGEQAATPGAEPIAVPDATGDSGHGLTPAPTHAERKKLRDEETARKKALREAATE